MLLKRMMCVGIVAALGACGRQGELLGQVPVKSSLVVNAPYQSLAECSLIRLTKLEPSGIHKSELPTMRTSKLALDGGGVRYWEITFTGTRRRRPVSI